MLYSTDCRKKLDLAFILDSSESMGKRKFQMSLDFVSNVVKQFTLSPADTRISLVTFSGHALVNFDLDAYNNKDMADFAIQTTKYLKGHTHTADALRIAREVVFQEKYGDRTDAPNVAILLTDGQSNVHPNHTIPQADAAKKAGIWFITIGVALKDKTEIAQIASHPQSVFTVNSFDALENITSLVMEKICDPSTGLFTH